MWHSVLAFVFVLVLSCKGESEYVVRCHNDSIPCGTKTTISVSVSALANDIRHRQQVDAGICGRDLV